MEEAKKKEIKELYELHKKIVYLQSKLRQSNEQVLLYVEGALNVNEFATIKAQRQAWRNELAILETKIKELRGEK